MEPARKFVLVGEDDMEDQFILQEYFNDNGFADSLIFRPDGKKLITYLEELSVEQFPALIILDLNMPVLNGTQTLYQLKQDQRFKHIPIIIYSTSTNENEKRKCFSFGAAEYIVKPHTMAEGQEMVELFITYL